MTLRSWQIALGGTLPALSSGLLLLLGPALPMTTRMHALGVPVTVDLVAVSFFGLILLAGLVPVALLAFERTLWVGALAAFCLASTFIGLIATLDILTLWARFVLALSGLGLLWAGAWSLPELWWARMHPIS